MAVFAFRGRSMVEPCSGIVPTRLLGRRVIKRLLLSTPDNNVFGTWNVVTVADGIDQRQRLPSSKRVVTLKPASLSPFIQVGV